jgi:PhnB protein
MSDVTPIPEGFNTLSPHIVVRNSVEAMEFYAKAFGAKRTRRMVVPGTEITLHAEMQIGSSTLMLVDEMPDMGFKSPQTLGGRHCTLHLFVDDADALFQQAIQAGCEESLAMQDAFWGDRYGRVVDPFGYEWSIATHKEELSEEQWNERAKSFFGDLLGL